MVVFMYPGHCLTLYCIPQKPDREYSSFVFRHLPPPGGWAKFAAGCEYLVFITRFKGFKNESLNIIIDLKITNERVYPNVAKVENASDPRRPRVQL